MEHILDKDFVLKTAARTLADNLGLSISASSKILDILSDLFGEIDFISSKNNLSVTIVDNDIIIRNFTGCKELAGCQKSSIMQYIRSIKKLMGFSGKDLLHIHSNDIRRFLLDYERTVSKITADNCRRNLNVFFQFMEDEGYIPKNPCKRIPKIKEEIKYKRFYTDLEMEHMRDNCHTKQETALIDLLLCTGLRVSEVSHIRLPEIDWERRTIIIHGKGNKDRIVPFTVRCKKHLQEFLIERGIKTSQFLFCSGRNPHRNLKNYSIQRIVKRIGSRANLPDITVHCFRRWLACDLNRKGMDFTVIQAILGHSSFQTTQRHYLDKNPDKMQYLYNLLVS